MKTFEYILDEEYGEVDKISFVPHPATEENFIFFAKQDEPRYIYTLKPEFANEPMIKENSHRLCKKYAKGEAVSYSQKTIKSWSRFTNYTKWGFKQEASGIFNSFSKDTDLGDCMFNCRHMLKKVPPKTSFNIINQINFSIETISDEYRRVAGPVMVANKKMYRPKEDINGVEDGECFFSNEVVEKLQKKFGIKEGATLLHSKEANISKQVIMTKSYIDKSTENWVWLAEYYIINDDIWESIKNGSLKGFSIEVKGVKAIEVK